MRDGGTSYKPKSKKELAKEQAIRLVRMYQSDPNPPQKKPGMRAALDLALNAAIGQNVGQTTGAWMHPGRTGGVGVLPVGPGGMGQSMLIKRLNSAMRGTRPENVRGGFFDGPTNDPSIELMPPVGRNPMHQEQAYNLRNALDYPEFMDQGLPNLGNIPFLRNALARAVKRPGDENRKMQDTMLQHFLYDLYGPGTRRNN